MRRRYQGRCKETGKDQLPKLETVRPLKWVYEPKQLRFFACRYIHADG